MAKGVKTGGGSRKGKPNKFTGELKVMILNALAGVGGVNYLQRQAEENPSAFMSLLGRVLPTTLSGDKENPLFGELQKAAGTLDGKLDKFIAAAARSAERKAD